MTNLSDIATILPDEDIFRFVGNIFIKKMYFDFSKGHRSCVGHSHKHDHVTLFAYGEFLVECDGIETVHKAPCFFDVPAGKHHKITALIDKSLAFCIHDTHGLEVEDLGNPYVA